MNVDTRLTATHQDGKTGIEIDTERWNSLPVDRLTRYPEDDAEDKCIVSPMIVTIHLPNAPKEETI